MNPEEQLFLNDLDKRLWAAADKLHANLNPSDYMHVVLGLVFLKYVSDAFKERREELDGPAHRHAARPVRRERRAGGGNPQEPRRAGL